MLSRRDLVAKLAAGSAMVWAAGMARTSFASTQRGSKTPTGAEGEALASQGPTSGPEMPAPGTRVVDAGPPETLSAPPPWELLHPLAVGSVVARGWRVAGLTGAVDGSCVLTLQNPRGRAQRVHLCRNDGRPQGLVYTERIDLIAMNGGQGDLPTEEGFGQAIAEIAHVLAANEGSHRQRPVLAALLPHAERVRVFAGPVARQLR